ncbi:hypothetical protein DS837_25915 [Azospirillum brasilense]|uniref:Uncharacterized protein n=1 Tax=Azospirillum brasilense TaxID=192 RepID=A0A6L3ATU0_AZOBR|nr:hypothetical protein DS837_25915 [Azospirillum brasilense]
MKRTGGNRPPAGHSRSRSNAFDRCPLPNPPPLRGGGDCRRFAEGTLSRDSGGGLGWGPLIGYGKSSGGRQGRVTGRMTRFAPAIRRAEGAVRPQAGTIAVA